MSRCEFLVEYRKGERKELLAEYATVLDEYTWEELLRRLGRTLDEAGETPIRITVLGQ